MWQPSCDEREIKMDLEMPRINQVTFGTRSLRILGPKIWNSLLLNVKSSENLSLFKEVIKNWNGLFCNCRICNFNDQFTAPSCSAGVFAVAMMYLNCLLCNEIHCLVNSKNLCYMK